MHGNEPNFATLVRHSWPFQRGSIINTSARRRGAILMGIVEFNHNPAKFYCPRMEREKRQNVGTSNIIGICASHWQGGPIFDLCQILLHSEMTPPLWWIISTPLPTENLIGPPLQCPQGILYHKGTYIRDLTVILFLSNGWSLYFIVQFSYWTHVHWVK